MVHNSVVEDGTYLLRNYRLTLTLKRSKLYLSGNLPPGNELDTLTVRIRKEEMKRSVLICGVSTALNYHPMFCSPNLRKNILNEILEGPSKMFSADSDFSPTTNDQETM